MLAYLYKGREGDQEHILGFEEYFRKMTDSELIAESIRRKKAGFCGVHMQALFLCALGNVMKERFNDTPIEILNNCILKFKDEGDPDN